MTTAPDAAAPRPLRAALQTALVNAVLLTVLIGASIGVGLLAEATGLPWLPYLVVVLVFSAMMGALRYSRERARARRVQAAKEQQAAPPSPPSGPAS